MPKWAADLGISVAKIEGAVGRIEKIDQRLEQLQENAVPMQAHRDLRADVAELMKQNLTAQSTWDEITQQVPTLWDDRTRSEGRQQAHRVWLVILTAATAILGGLVALQTLGVSIAIHSHG